MPRPLYRGVLLQRYKRFLADVELADGRTVTAHCADPGRLPGLAVPGATVWLSHDPAPHRKLAWTLELVEQGSVLVAINSRNPNRLAREGLDAGRFAFARGFGRAQSEPRIRDGTRLDFVLVNEMGTRLFVEVKGVTWKRDGLAQFPDAPTRRGTRHLHTLRELVRGGEGAALLLVAQRADVEAFTPAADVDPAYAGAFAAAVREGVHVEAWRCRVNLELIVLDRQIALV